MDTTSTEKMENVLLAILKLWLSGKYTSIEDHERCSWALGCVVSFGMVCFGSALQFLKEPPPAEIMISIMGILHVLMIIPLQIVNSLCHQHHGKTLWQAECWTFGNCICVFIPGAINIGLFAFFTL